MSPLPTTVPGMLRTRIRAAVGRHPSDLGTPDRTAKPAPRRRPAAPRRKPAAPRTPEQARQHTLLLRMLSLLLQYPDAELASAGTELRNCAAELAPSPEAEHVTAFLDWFTTEDPDALQTHYVSVFDLRRRSSLYLTYYLHGDTRRRGMALLTLAQRYRAAGWEADSGELPDHLPVVLEFAALAGPGRGEAPLRQHRRGLRLIHRALVDAGSPYQHLLEALCELLPPAGEEDEEAVARLMAQGPPNEEVGADPYGAPDGGPSHLPYGNGEFAPYDAFVPPMPAPPTPAQPANSRTDGPR